MLQVETRLGRAIPPFVILKVLIIPLMALTPLVPANSQFSEKQPLNCVCGTLDAPIRLEVFSDFQCSYCRMFYLETVAQVRKNYAPSDKICVIYYEFPLSTHAYGRKAARYSLAAQRVGRKQWLAAMDTLYAKQDQWSQDGNIEAALKDAISVEDLGSISKLLQDPSIDEAIDRDIALGEKRGVTGTPAVFMTALNKERLKASYLSYEVWKDIFSSIVK